MGRKGGAVGKANTTAPKTMFGANTLLPGADARAITGAGTNRPTAGDTGRITCGTNPAAVRPVGLETGTVFEGPHEPPSHRAHWTALLSAPWPWNTYMPLACAEMAT